MKHTCTHTHTSGTHTPRHLVWAGPGRQQKGYSSHNEQLPPLLPFHLMELTCWGRSMSLQAADRGLVRVVTVQGLGTALVEVILPWTGRVLDPGSEVNQGQKPEGKELRAGLGLGPRSVNNINFGSSNIVIMKNLIKIIKKLLCVGL